GWSVTGVQTCALPISGSRGGKAGERVAVVGQGERAHGNLDGTEVQELPRFGAEDVEAAHRVPRGIQEAEARVAAEVHGRPHHLEIGRASCRERGRSWV